MRGAPDTRSPAAAVPTAQDVWLENLSSANGFTRWVLNEVDEWLGARILEVGCGTGSYTAAMAGADRHIVAVEKNEAYVQAARRRLEAHRNVLVLHGDAAALDIPMPEQGRAYDTLILFDVLEHIELDIEVLARLRQRLCSGGHLILKVPAGPWLYSPMDQALGHCRRYDKAGLNQVVTRAGYELVAIWPFNAIAVAGWWWNGRIRGLQTPPANQVALFDRLVPVLRPLDRVARHLCGISLFAIGRKPG